jgi:hypothetical protein
MNEPNKPDKPDQPNKPDQLNKPNKLKKLKKPDRPDKRDKPRWKVSFFNNVPADGVPADGWLLENVALHVSVKSSKIRLEIGRGGRIQCQPH